MRQDIANAKLYVTLEPSCERRGEAMPPLTDLIEQTGLKSVIIGCPDPIPERATEGAAALHNLGISVTMGIEEESCQEIISQYAELANSKLQRMARLYFQKFQLVRTFLSP